MHLFSPTYLSAYPLSVSSFDVFFPLTHLLLYSLSLPISQWYPFLLPISWASFSVCLSPMYPYPSLDDPLHRTNLLMTPFFLPISGFSLSPYPSLDVPFVLTHLFSPYPSLNVPFLLAHFLMFPFSLPIFGCSLSPYLCLDVPFLLTHLFSSYPSLNVPFILTYLWMSPFSLSM